MWVPVYTSNRSILCPIYVRAGPSCQLYQTMMISRVTVIAHLYWSVERAAAAAAVAGGETSDLGRRLPTVGDGRCVVHLLRRLNPKHGIVRCRPPVSTCVSSVTRTLADTALSAAVNNYQQDVWHRRTKRCAADPAISRLRSCVVSLDLDQCSFDF